MLSSRGIKRQIRCIENILKRNRKSIHETGLSISKVMVPTPDYPEPISLELIISDIDVLGIPTTIYRKYPLDEETYPLLKPFMTEEDKQTYRVWRRQMAMAYLSAQREKVIMAQMAMGF